MQNYIAELRQLIGHRPILMVGAGVIVTDAAGRLLLHERSDNHAWSIPGGATEPGETVEDTARRETQEEAGLTLADLRLFGVFSGPEFFYEYPNGDQVHNVSIVYECSSYNDDFGSYDSETLNLRFFHPDEIDLATVSPPVRPILRRWLAQRQMTDGKARNQE